MTQLDSDADLMKCSSALVKATSAFGAGGNTTSASSSTVNAALNTLCGATSSCPEDTLRSKLTGFYAACQPELTSNQNADVVRAYDVLYALYPLTQSVCSKGDDGRYCVISLGSTTSGSSSGAASPSGKVALAASKPDSPDLQEIQKSLWTSVAPGSSVARRDEQAFYPNTTTFREANILFLLLQPTLSEASLCVTCTRNVISAYIAFQTAIPYAPGISSSSLMGGETALYNAVQNTCGPSFLSNSVQAAGGISGGIVNTGSALGMMVNFRTLGAAALIGLSAAL